MTATTSQALLTEQLNQATRRKTPKGVEPALTVGVAYNAELQMIVREVSKDVNKHIVPLVRRLTPQYQADSAIETLDTWVDQIVGALTLLKNKWSSPQFVALSNRIASKFVLSASAVNQKRFNESVRGFGINVFGDSQELQDYLSASAYDNARLIQSIPAQYITQIDSIVMTNVRAGGRPSAITKLLVDQFGVTQRRAKMIARDQTAKINGDLASKRQQNAGFEYFQWVDSDDERVRDRHADISEKVTAYGEGIYRWDNPPLSSKGVPIIPGQDYQCFPGSLQLDNTTFCNKLYRRWYTGELTELVFNDGVVLSATANHPILTDKGFKPAHLIDSRDNIVRTLDEGLLSIELNRQGVKPTFEEIFSTFDFLGVEVSVSASVHDEFHGDTSDSDIDIIELNGLLMDVINPSINQLLDECGFTWPDKAFIFSTFTCIGDADFSNVTFRDTFSRFMSANSLKLSLFFAHLTPLEGFGLALGSWFNPEAFELSTDNISGNTKMFSDCVFAFAVLVHGNHLFTECVDSFFFNHSGGFNSSVLDRSMNDTLRDSSDNCDVSNGTSTTYKVDNIIDNRVVSFNGHVYNLQTISGDYNTCATVVSNCRCIARPVSNAEVAANNKAGRVRSGVLR